METTDYVSYTLALALKKAGFNWKCDHYWCKVYADSDKMEMRQASADDYNNDDWNVPHCSAPHIYQAQKWLREKCGIHIDAYPYTDTSSDADGQVCEEWQYWGADLIQVATGGGWIAMPADNCDSYEQALSAGIEAAIELIEKKGD